MGSGKKGGSQLAQLRSGLRDAGITGSNSKKGKRNDRDDSRVGQYRAQQRRKRLEALMTNLNAFDERVASSKNQALGAKIKGASGRPANAKSSSIQQRRERLLPEYQNRHHSSSFHDRRFGEYNPHMSLEDKMLKRFTHERMHRTPKTSNTSLFDLNDDDDADLTLTHYGQSLSGMDELPDVRLDDDDDDDGMCFRTWTHAKQLWKLETQTRTIEHYGPWLNSYHGCCCKHNRLCRSFLESPPMIPTYSSLLWNEIVFTKPAISLDTFVCP